jgi:hypothetical protein
MKRPLQRRQLSAQLNLPLLSVPASVLPDGEHAELVLALVDLLVSAATEQCPGEGGDDEHQAHR